MNRPAHPPTVDDAATAAADLHLRQALRSLPPPLGAAQLAALQARVLAQWPGGAAPGAAQPQATGLVRPGRQPRLVLPRRGWVLACGLLLGVSLAAGLWLKRPDPVLEELLQPDVLSQMAIGQM